MAQQPWPHSLATLMAATPLVVIGVLGLTSDPRPSMAPGSWETTGGSRIRLTEQLAEREIELDQRRDAQLLMKGVHPRPDGSSLLGRFFAVAG